jgi:uncharacterized membrane protein YccC
MKPGLDKDSVAIWRESLLSLPAMPVLLLIGMASGNELRGAIAAGAAFSVGFGVSHGLHGRRWGAMLAAAVGIASAALIGSLAGNALWVLIPLAGFGAAICAIYGLRDDDLWWVTLQIVIALLVAGNFPGSWIEAAERSLTTLLGGATQILIATGLARLFPAAVMALPAQSPKPATTRPQLLIHALRAAVCVMLALVLARKAGLANAYWAPMTALLVIKPRLLETRARGAARLLGTLLGCAAATLFVMLVHAMPALLLLGLTFTATSAFALQKANYASMTAAVTGTIVLLISLSTADVVATSEHRLLATIIGGGIALLVAWIPSPEMPLK